MPKTSKDNSQYDRPPLWMLFLYHATRFMVFGYTLVRETVRGVGRESIRRMAVPSVRTDRHIDNEVNMVHVVCAACKSVIGILEDDDDMEDHAEAIAEWHYDLCSATEEVKQQAIIDVQFRNMTKGFEL